MILGDFQNEKLHNVAWVADSFNTLVVDSDRLGSQSVQRLQLCPRDSPSNRPWSASVPVRPVSTAGGMSRRLLLLGVLVSLGALNTEAASTLRSRRQAEVCEEATDSFDECTNAWVDNCDLWHTLMRISSEPMMITRQPLRQGMMANLTGWPGRRATTWRQLSRCVHDFLIESKIVGIIGMRKWTYRRLLLRGGRYQHEGSSTQERPRGPGEVGGRVGYRQMWGRQVSFYWEMKIFQKFWM